LLLKDGGLSIEFNIDPSKSILYNDLSTTFPKSAFSNCNQLTIATAHGVLPLLPLFPSLTFISSVLGRLEPLGQLLFEQNFDPVVVLTG
jgi:hypothetical protein